MKKIIFVISVCILTCSVHAQVEHTNSVRDTVKTEQIENKSNKSFFLKVKKVKLKVKKTFQNFFSSKKKENKQIDRPNNNQISTDIGDSFEKCYNEKKALKDSLDNVKKELEKTSVALRNKQDSLNKELYKKTNEYDSVIRESKRLLDDNIKKEASYNKLVSTLKDMDAIVYKQCLLYPLEREYDEYFINETLDAAKGFKSLGDSVVSEDFLKYYETYEHLIEDYKKYNDALLEYLKKVKEYMIKGNWELNPTLKNIWKEDLERLEYYKDYYKKRNNEPYESIIYLDNIIEEFVKEILKRDNTKNVEKEINDLINKLYDENANKTKS